MSGLPHLTSSSGPSDPMDSPGPTGFAIRSPTQDSDHHLLYAAGTQLASHLEIITTTVTVKIEYQMQSPTSVMAYPAFRGEGWSTRLNVQAAERIDTGRPDIGVLICAPELMNFYSRAGWTTRQEP